jgi:UDP-N-acetylmuramate--alanine ligase
VTLFDDYGHHPIEIRATLQSLRGAFPNRRIVTLFQPHRFSRTRDLFQEFTQAFDDTDLLYLAEIYPAGEKPIVGISSRALYDTMVNQKVFYHSDNSQLISSVVNGVQPGDVILTLGAGDITKVGHELVKKLKYAEYRMRNSG